MCVKGEQEERRNINVVEKSKSEVSKVENDDQDPQSADQISKSGRKRDMRSGKRKVPENIATESKMLLQLQFSVYLETVCKLIRTRDKKKHGGRKRSKRSQRDCNITPMARNSSSPPLQWRKLSL